MAKCKTPVQDPETLQLVCLETGEVIEERPMLAIPEPYRTDDSEAGYMDSGLYNAGTVNAMFYDYDIGSTVSHGKLKLVDKAIKLSDPIANRIARASGTLREISFAINLPASAHIRAVELMRRYMVRALEGRRYKINLDALAKACVYLALREIEPITLNQYLTAIKDSNASLTKRYIRQVVMTLGLKPNNPLKELIAKAGTRLGLTSQTIARAHELVDKFGDCHAIKTLSIPALIGLFLYLAMANGNERLAISSIASALGISENTLYRAITRYKKQC